MQQIKSPSEFPSNRAAGVPDLSISIRANEMSNRKANESSPTRDRGNLYKSGHGTQAQFHRVRSYLDSQDEDEWEGHHIVMKKGKYQGRKAFVKSRVNMKYRVMVDGVEDQLEFYPTSFLHDEARAG